ncbi:hypothetical protein RND81_13G159800 [Saponaria officinalis]|uniref:SHSP domain-containing protein n=1 Tax=Saponaria officinalis TaxID=3572 RepID=A0AAW1H0I4_SAPOF
MQNNQAMLQHHNFFGRHSQMFEPFPLHFPNNFPHDFPFGSPMMLPPRPFLPPMPPMPRTKIDYKETSEAHHFMVDLPGLRKEDINVRVEDGNMLHISANKKHDMEQNGENYYHVQRGCGAFMTKFMLPPNIKPEHMNCCVENGLLTVTVPKETVDTANQRQDCRY